MNAVGVATGKTAVESIAVRQTSPLGAVMDKAMARNTRRPSGESGMPPPVEKRPITLDCPWANTLATESRVPCPLPSKWPVKQ